jgi:hypothetical protein
MLKGMSSCQFQEWIAYYELEPFGDEWLRSALIASLIAETNRNTEERSEPFSPQDFLPAQREPEVEEDPDESWKRNKEILSMMAMRKSPPPTPPQIKGRDLERGEK